MCCLQYAQVPVTVQTSKLMPPVVGLMLWSLWGGDYEVGAMRWLKIGAWLVAGLMALLGLILIAAYSVPSSRTLDVEFTRHVGHYAGRAATAQQYTNSFTSVPGTGYVEISHPLTHAIVELNGDVLTQQTMADVELLTNNTLRVSVIGELDTPVTVRVRQQQNIETHTYARVHFNTNVRNFEEARAFYGQLGFATLSGFPDTNTQAMARAIGIETPTHYDGQQGADAGGYLLHGELIYVGELGSGLIDLIEFTIPRNEAPPYDKLNRLGFAKAAMHTRDIDAAYAHLSKVGVKFLAPPITRSDGVRFAVFTDPDGTFYELLESREAAKGSAEGHLVGLGAVTINVSDFERSAAWYRMLGYEVTQDLSATENLAVAQAMGFDEPIAIKAAQVTQAADGSTLKLVQWLSPYDATPPYPIPINHIGIHRMAFSTSNLAADMAMLQEQGVEFISPATPCCSGPDSPGSIVAFYDPDGTIVELVEQPVMDQLMLLWQWLSGARG